MGDSKTITVSTESGEVIVRKLALGDYAALLRALDKLPKQLADIAKRDKKDLTTDFIIGQLPTLAADSLPELAGVVAAATDKDQDFMVGLDLADFADVVVAVFELNDYTRVVAAVKKVMALKQPRQPQPNQ